MTEKEAIRMFEDRLKSDVIEHVPEYAEAMKMAVSTLKEIQQYRGIGTVEDRRKAIDGWIPVEERLPQEKVNPVSQDFCEYQVTARFEGLLDVRHYKYGRGHWWNGPGIVDQYVVAWRENPAPYKPTKGDANGQE